MANSTIAQITARDRLNTLALSLIEPENAVPVVSVLSQALEATREFLPSELYYTVTTILDDCAQAERRN